MNYQRLQVIVDIRVMDVLIEIFRNSRKLRNQAQCINDNYWIVVMAQKAVFIDDTKAIGLNELLSKLLAALSTKYKSWNKSDADGNRFRMQVLKSIQSQVNDICFGKTCADLVNLALVNLLVKWNVKDLQDCDHHLLGGFDAASTFDWPLLDT